MQINYVVYKDNSKLYQSNESFDHLAAIDKNFYIRLSKFDNDNTLINISILDSNIIIRATFLLQNVLFKQFYNI